MLEPLLKKIILVGIAYGVILILLIRVLIFFVDNPRIIQEMGKNAYKFFLENYTVERSYRAIMRHIKRDDNV